MGKNASKTSKDPTLFQKIQQDREFLESVFDRIPGMIYIHDLVNDVNLYRSWTLKKILGMSDSTQMNQGKTIRSLIHVDDVDEFNKAAKRLKLAQDNGCIRFNYRMQHNNGKWLWFRSEEYVYERDAAGTPTKCLGYATDLTSTVEQQEELDRLNSDNQFLLKAAQILSQPNRKYKVALQELAANVSLYYSVVCDISILNRETNVICPEAVYHPDKEVRDIILNLFNQRTVKRGEGLVGAVIETGKEILFKVVPEEMRIGPRSVDKRIVPISMIYVPLLGTNSVLGSLNITRLEGQKEFTEFQLEGIRRLGDYVSLFVENGLLKEQQEIETEARKAAELLLEQEKKWAEFKLEISHLLASADVGFKKIIERLAKRVAEYFDVVCDVQLLDEESGTINLAAIFHPDKAVKTAIENQLTKRQLRLGEGMVGEAVASGKEFFMPLLSDELRKKSEAANVNPIIIPCSFVYIPLKSNGRVLGTLDLTRLSAQHPLTEDELVQMRDLANHAAQFVEIRMLQVEQKKEIELRKKAEQRNERTTRMLEQMEAETRMILNAIPIYIARISTDLRYLFLNEAYRKRGMNPRKSEGKKVKDVIGSKELAKLMVHVEQVLEGNVVNYEYESSLNDGVHRHFNVVLAPDFAADGSVVGFYSCSIDMTTKVLAEQEAKLTQERLESLSLNSGDAFFFHDLEQNILDVNQVATDMLGYSREEFLTMKASEIDPIWKRERYKRYLDVMEVNTPQTFETTVVKKDGTDVPVEVRFVKRVEGKKTYIQSLIRDRTEKRDQELKLQRSEERLRLVFDNVEDHIAIVNAEGIFESINKTTQGLEIEDVVGHSIYEFVENPAQLKRDFEKLKSGGGDFQDTSSYTGPDGTLVVYSRKYIGIFYAKKFYRAILIVRDITAERNRELAEMSAVLRGQEQERKRLSAELHDGIGQVLSAIALQVSQVREEVLSNDVENITQDLTNLNDNLQEAIREVRNISHDLMPEVLESFGLKEAINQTCSNLHDRSGINVMFDYADLAPRYNRLVEVNLFRITQELLSNIQKHASCSKVFVSLMDHGESLNLTIEDDGVGFNTKDPSSGIGLSNVISRVNSMSGQIDIESAENSGTLVNIDVPKKRE